MKTVAKSTLKNYAESIVVHVEHGGHPAIFEHGGTIYFDANSKLGGQHELMYNESENCEILVDEEVLHEAMCDLQYETYDELSDEEEMKLLDKIAELISETLVKEGYTVVDDSMTDNEKYGKMLAIVEFFHSRDFGNEDFTRANYNARMRFTTYAGKSIFKMHSNLIDRYAKSNKSPDDFLFEFGKIAVDLNSGDLSDKKVELDAMYIKVFYNTLRVLADKYDIELFSKEYYKK